MTDYLPILKRPGAWIIFAIAIAYYLYNLKDPSIDQHRVTLYASVNITATYFWLFFSFKEPAFGFLRGGFARAWRWLGLPVFIFGNGFSLWTEPGSQYEFIIFMTYLALGLYLFALAAIQGIFAPTLAPQSYYQPLPTKTTTSINPLDSFAPFPDSLTAIDFETANKNPNSAISIGVTTIKNGQITGSKTWMIKPPVMRFNEDFIDIHHITPDMVRDKPTFAEIFSELEPYLESDALLAHYATFDRRVLKETAAHYGIRLPKIRWICTCELSREVWDDLPNHKLPTVSNYLGIELNHHEAGSDANACAEIYLKTVYGSGWGPGGWRTK